MYDLLIYLSVCFKILIVIIHLNEHYFFLSNLITIFCHSNFAQNGNTALHQACKGCHTDTVYCLLSHGADQTVKNNEGKTSLDEASNDEIVNLLTKHNPKRGIFTDNSYIIH